ncbi:ArsR/SmtB family transcription factor [Streptomyces sp. NBC_01390]|uniref:ArsR/SmtB family transcription factor n=1 Tax=Streptomyces sp. NBC_01390 TaxID=2903850 RepID=UPI00386F3AF5
MRRSLPASTRPLWDLVSPVVGSPEFADAASDTVTEGLSIVRAAPPDLIRTGIEMLHPSQASPTPRWIRGLYQGHAESWQLLLRAQLDAYETILQPNWLTVQDLHQTEFTRHALATAEHGIGAALAALLPSSRLHDGVWEIDMPRQRDIRLGGRGAILMPTFHWTGNPFVSDLPDRPLLLVYPAGSGLPLPPATGNSDPLAGVLGQTRADLLRLLAHEHTTSDAARHLKVSNATVSEHTTALRKAGLITTVRAGRAVLHHRTPLGTMLCTRSL